MIGGVVEVALSRNDSEPVVSAEGPPTALHSLGQGWGLKVHTNILLNILSLTSCSINVIYPQNPLSKSYSK